MAAQARILTMAGNIGEIVPLGDTAAIVRLGDGIEERTRLRVLAFAMAIDRAAFPWMMEWAETYTGVTVFYDPLKVVRGLYGRQRAGLGCPKDSGLVGAGADVSMAADEQSPVFRAVCAQLEELLVSVDLAEPSQLQGSLVEIPVCYGGRFGPDLEELASGLGLTPAEVIRRHAGTEYVVHMLGFMPGFPYLGGLPPELSAPRRGTPRIRVPAGSVGIAGSQTGVYPLESPGGWNLIGRTPARLFRPNEVPPSLLKAGDRVRFVPIGVAEYAELGGDLA